jgi:O-antigen/teichoic acid export membrane protein
MRQTLIKYISEREGDHSWQIGVARFAGTVNLAASGVVGAAVALLLLFTLPVDFRGVTLIVVIVGLLWSEQMLQYAGGILYGLHREEEAALPASVGVIFGGVFGVVLAVAGFGVLGVLTGLLAAGILTAGVAMHLAWRAVGRVGDSQRPVSEGNVQPPPRRELLTFGVSTMAYAGVAMALYSVDIVLVRHFAGDQQTGLYAAAVQWSEFVWFIPIAIEGVMLQATARLWSQDRVQEITQLVSRLVRYVALTTGFLLVFVLVFSRHIVTLYFGPEFVQAALPLQLLVPGAFAFSLARVIRPVLQAHGSVMTLLKIVLVATAGNIALNIALVPWWGAAGAAVATSVSFIGVAMAYVMLLRGEGADAFHSFSGSRFMALCTAIAAILVPIALSIRSSVAALAMGGMVAAGLYWAAVLWLGLLRVRELGQIVESLPGPFRGVGIKLMRWCHPMLMRLEALA